jgi:hypothetical protein
MIVSARTESRATAEATFLVPERESIAFRREDDPVRRGGQQTTYLDVLADLAIGPGVRGLSPSPVERPAALYR